MLASEPKVSAIFQAAEVARRDFALRLEKERDPSWRLSAYVANIGNYDIGLSENQEFYVVVFLLRKTTVPINGGGAEYRLDKKSLKIVKSVGYK